MKRNVITVKSKDTFINPINHVKMTMKLVKVNEPTKIGKVKFNNIHYYDDKNGQFHQWFKKPSYNLDSDYSKYRKIMNLMTPKQISTLRHRWGLSQRELASVFGISYSTLSSIENGEYVQSVAQNNILRNLFKPELMYSLIKSNLRRIALVKPNHVSSDVLADKAKKIAKLV